MLLSFQALLAIISKLIEQEQQQPQGVKQQQQPQGVQQQKDDHAGQQQQQQQQRWQKLEAFLRSQPVATSIPFISWLADIEATETGGGGGSLWVTDQRNMMAGGQGSCKGGQ